MSKKKHPWHIRIPLDILGFFLMIISPFLGWLPGPGGIPLFIAGLSIVAINHEWAERYLEIIKKYADRIGDLIFAENKRLQMFYDVFGPLLIIAAIGLFVVTDSYIFTFVSGVIGIFGIILLLGNRHRYKKLKRKILNKK